LRVNKLPDASVGLIVTSPPYNVRISTGNGMKIDTAELGAQNDRAV
jgi:DNA modification methylase